jgi:DNA-binding MarR family transcriptional regulator
MPVSKLGYNRTEAGAALLEVTILTLQAAFMLRAAGKRAGLVSAEGGGVWGLLRSLKLGGPQTVPALARARPVARQHIQTLADELANRGLVRFVDNPAHRRSRLVTLTAAGERAYDAMTRKAAEIADRLAAGLELEKLRHAAEILHALSDRLQAMLAAGLDEA